jgi:tetratricopeptide (TPR) repeat protein
VAYLKIDSVDKAIEHLRAIIEREKDSEHTHHYLGLAYLEKEELDSSALHLEKAAEMGISEKMAIYYADLAKVKQMQYQYKEAIQHYEEAYAHSDNPEHLFHLARNCDLYYKDKRIANKYYQRYLATGNDKYHQYTLDRMKQLREIIHFQGH